MTNKQNLITEVNNAIECANKQEGQALSCTVEWLEMVQGGIHQLVTELEEAHKENERLLKAMDRIHTDSTDAWAAGYALRVQQKGGL